MTDAALIVLVTVAAVSVTFVIVLLVLRGQKRRREALSAAADRRGALFEPRPDHEFAAKLRDDFWIFRYIRRNTVSNLIRLSGGGATYRLFDYAYWRPTSRAPSLMTVLLITSPDLDLPAFTMGDSGGPLRLRDSLVAKPLQFSLQSFNEAHQIHADDAAEVQSLFAEDLQTFLAQRPHLCMEATGANILIYAPIGRLKPELAGTRIDEGATVLGGLVSGA